VDLYGLVLEPLNLRLEINQEIRERIKKHREYELDFDASSAELERLSKKLDATDSRLIQAQGVYAVAEKAYATLHGDLLEELQALVDCRDAVVVPTADQIKLCQYKFFSLGAGMTRSCLSANSLRSLGEADAKVKTSALDDLTWTRREATGTPSGSGLASEYIHKIETLEKMSERASERGEEETMSSLKGYIIGAQGLLTSIEEADEAKRKSLADENYLDAHEAKGRLKGVQQAIEDLFDKVSLILCLTCRILCKMKA